MEKERDGERERERECSSVFIPGVINAVVLAVVTAKEVLDENFPILAKAMREVLIDSSPNADWMAARETRR